MTPILALLITIELQLDGSRLMDCDLIGVRGTEALCIVAGQETTTTNCRLIETNLFGVVKANCIRREEIFMDGFESNA